MRPWVGGAIGGVFGAAVIFIAIRIEFFFIFAFPGMLPAGVIVWTLKQFGVFEGTFADLAWIVLLGMIFNIAIYAFLGWWVTGRHRSRKDRKGK